MQSDDTGSYLNRRLAPALAEALADTPVVCLLGPRHCGKSTLARRQAPDRAYLSLDDRNYLDFARHDPQGFVDALPEQVTIDEIQRVPELTLAMKRSVDANRRPGRFLGGEFDPAYDLLTPAQLNPEEAERLAWFTDRLAGVKAAMEFAQANGQATNNAPAVQIQRVEQCQ